MTKPSPLSRICLIALLASLTLSAGCGGEPAINDTAETTRPDSAKPAPTPTLTPETQPAKDAPKD